MESAICLRHYPFPYGSKGFQGARPSRFHHLKINHATPLSLPQISTTRSPVTRSFGHVNCMLERFISVPSENEGSGNRILRGVAAASLVLTCVLGLFSFSGKNMNPKLTTAYASPSDEHKYDFTSDLEAQGRFALKSLFKIPSDQALAKKEMLSNFGKGEPNAEEVNILKWLAILRRSDEAHKKLEKHYDKCIEDQHNDSEGLGPALVEVLMYKGDFNGALNRVNNIIGELKSYLPRSPSKLYHENESHYEELRQAGLTLYKGNKDNQLSGLSKLYHVKDQNNYVKLQVAQVILYKAILHTVLGMEEKEREQWWNAFIKTCRK